MKTKTKKKTKTNNYVTQIIETIRMNKISEIKLLSVRRPKLVHWGDFLVMYSLVHT